MPAAAVVIPAYESHATIAGCLDALRRQTWRDFEIVVVDSSPGVCTQEVVTQYPEVRYIRHRGHLLPFAAREIGIRATRAELIVSTDPDIYPAPDWLERLVAHHRATGCAVAGSVSCYGERAFDWGVHFCKYHESLPYRPAGPMHAAASANLLFTRAMYEAVGPVRTDVFCSDYLFTSALVERGYMLWFEPCARVSHDHVVTWRKYVEERFTRGQDFGQTRLTMQHWSRLRLLTWLVISVLPVRLARLLLRIAMDARRGRVLGRYLRTLPAVAVGFSAWLAGEAAAYAQGLQTGMSSR